MEMKYTKIPFTDAERGCLQEQAKAKGMRLSEYIRECLFNERSYEIHFDEEMIEEHTNALINVKEGLKEIYYTSFDDKVLLSGFFRDIHERMHVMEINEAKIRRDIRQIKTILREESMEGLEEGESIADDSM